MFEGNVPSLADIAAVTDKNDGWGGNSAWVLIILFALIFGWGGNGWNNRNVTGEAVATSADVQRSFDTQSILNKLNGLENGLCDGFYAQNTTMLNGFNSVGNLIQQAQFANQQWCCETNRNIDAVRYEDAKNTCDIIQAQNCNTQKILDAITGNRMADMQNQINQLQLQSALCGVVRYPNAVTYTAGYSPCFGGYNNNSCGCC